MRGNGGIKGEHPVLEQEGSEDCTWPITLNTMAHREA
jgi:hypothetical protein